MSDLAASAPVAAQLEQDTERDQSPSMNNAVTATEDVEMKDAPAGGTLLSIFLQSPSPQVDTT